MTRDASLPPNAPMTNGTLTPDVHGEADASSTSAHQDKPRHVSLNTEQQQSAGDQVHDGHRDRDARRQSLREVCADINARVTAFLAAPSDGDDTLRRTQEHTKTAVGVIEKALEDYTFEHLSLSYNGGKDCLVLLLLYLSVLHTYFNGQNRDRRKDGGNSNLKDLDDTGFPKSIPSIYAKPPDPFPLVTEFVESSSVRYHLDLVHISTSPSSHPKSKSHSSPPPTDTNIPAPPAQSTNSASHSTGHPTSDNPHPEAKVITFRDAFSLYLSQTHPSCRAIFVGTRRTDPHGATLSHFTMTDGLWPRFMRVHPVLEWGLSEIWAFLRDERIRDGVGIGQDGTVIGVGGNKGIVEEEKRLGQGQTHSKTIDYCAMYDQGYTSLGGVNDTHRNPKLKDPNSPGGYRPAWSMTADVEERLGRE